MSQPGQVLFNGDGRRVVGTRIATSEIDSFTVGQDGRLTPAAGSPYDAQAFSPAQGWGQLGSEFSPTSPDQMFVSDAHTAAGGAAFPGLVSFIDAPDGTLTPVGAPVANDGGAAFWIEISQDGKFLFVVNTASASISSYSIGAGGSLGFLQSTGPGQVGGGAEDARLSPDGSTLWVVESGMDSVTGFHCRRRHPHPVDRCGRPAGSDSLGHRRHLIDGPNAVRRDAACPASPQLSTGQAGTPARAARARFRRSSAICVSPCSSRISAIAVSAVATCLLGTGACSTANS